MSNLLELTTAEPVSTYTNPHGQIDALIAQHGADQIALEDMLYGSIRNPVPRVEAPGLGLLEYVDTGPLIGMKALAGLVGKGGKTLLKINQTPIKNIKIGGGQVFPEGLSAEMTVSEMTNAIKEGVELPPIVINKAGYLLDGRHRLETYKRLGYKNVPTIVE